ncbi:MAG: GNAT family N-acetyltransferase [Desulfocapsaceae bacterium]
MSITITVAPITSQDRDGVLQITRMQKNFLDCEIAIAVEVIDGSLTSTGDYHTLVARDSQKRVLGFLSFGAVPLTENRFDLYWIAVDPGAGRAGIGTRLLREMETHLRLNGSGHIYIDTSSTEGYLAARKFYENNGYQVVAHLKDFYRAGDDKMIYRKIY